jgi:hypothetical protein
MTGHPLMGWFGFCNSDCQTVTDSLVAEMAFFRLLRGLLTSGLDSF